MGRKCPEPRRTLLSLEDQPCRADRRDLKQVLFLLWLVLLAIISLTHTEAGRLRIGGPPARLSRIFAE
jgi:hypothetical protein